MFLKFRGNGEDRMGITWTAELVAGHVVLRYRFRLPFPACQTENLPVSVVCNSVRITVALSLASRKDRQFAWACGHWKRCADEPPMKRTHIWNFSNDTPLLSLDTIKSWFPECTALGSWMRAKFAHEHIVRLIVNETFCLMMLIFSVLRL